VPTVDARRRRRSNSSPRPPARRHRRTRPARRLEAWLVAWSARDYDAYRAFYTADFKPAKGRSTADWEAERRQRLAEARSPSLRIEGLRLKARGPDRSSTVSSSTTRRQLPRHGEKAARLGEGGRPVEDRRRDGAGRTALPQDN
jgi:hypothetical protein